MRTSTDEFRALDLRVHSFLQGVPLHDVHTIDLPGGGPGRHLSDVRALLPSGAAMKANSAVAFLFGLRFLLGRLFGWDRVSRTVEAASYLHRLDADDRARSQVPPGSADGPFRALYLFPNEGLSEAQNATVHAFLCAVLEPRPEGYRLYWAVYVLPVSRLTPVYMSLIDPFRRWLVYPSILELILSRWQATYGAG